MAKIIKTSLIIANIIALLLLLRYRKSNEYQIGYEAAMSKIPQMIDSVQSENEKKKLFSDSIYLKIKNMENNRVNILLGEIVKSAAEITGIIRSSDDKGKDNNKK